MMSRMTGQRLQVDGDYRIPLNDMLRTGVRGKPDVSALASLDAKDRRLYILAWHYHDDDVPGEDAKVELSLSNLPFALAAATIRHYRIDQTHSNAFTAWKRMRSPAKPTPEQYSELLAAGQLAELPEDALTKGPELTSSIALTLPRQAVSLLILDWAEIHVDSVDAIQLRCKSR
jgi:xylan 1,4-beta-xylosidase